MPLPPSSTLFPYTTLFRSVPRADHEEILIVLVVFLQRLIYLERAVEIFLVPPTSDIECRHRHAGEIWRDCLFFPESDRKSTRLNSSHQIISYAVFCLKKKN